MAELRPHPAASRPGPFEPFASRSPSSLRPNRKNLPRRLRGLTLATGAHRYHPWALNRRWPRPAGDNLPVAEPVDATLEKFAEALHYFLERTRIAGGLPAPPHEPRLAL